MFKKGQTYKRADIHQLYGGQEQGGISTPARHDFIMIFTASSGEQYGYKDGWLTPTRFLYTGEGQEGDMTFIRGNAAIRDHEKNKKAIFLFEYRKQGFVEYIGQMVYRGHELRDGIDKNGNPRKIIVFEFSPVSDN